MSTVLLPNSERSERWRWFVSSLAMAPLALFVYGAFEWLFFVTKASPVSFLPVADRLLVLVQMPVPFLLPVLLVQLAASLPGLIAFPRLVRVSLVPAALLLAALVLVLADNFLNAIFEVSAARAQTATTRILFLVILVAAFLIWMRKLAETPVSRTWRYPLFAWALLFTMLAPGVFARAPRRVTLPTIPEPKAKNVLLLSIDGVDAERLSAYGYPASTSPFLASLRDETIFCENAFANAAQTYGSLASMLTGREPFETRVIVPPSMLRGDAAFEHLPGILNRSGYRTLQLSVRHFADAEDANLLGGFDRSNYRWENRLSLSRVEQTYDTARPFRLAVVDRIESRLSAILGLRRVGDEFAEVTGRAADPFWSDARRIETLLRFIDEPGPPWFAHVHLLDTHAGGHQADGAASSDGGLRYEQSLAAADRNVGRVLAALTSRRELDSTIVVITSDHGSGWSTTRRIPLLIRLPEAKHARREEANVSNLDIAPTILDALGVNKPAWMSGRSLLRSPVAETPIFAVASSGEQLDTGLIGVNVPRPPNYGARSASVILGSSWYAIDLRTGMLDRGMVAGHTRPRPLVTPAHARAVLEDELSRYGFEIASDEASRRARAK